MDGLMMDPAALHERANEMRAKAEAIEADLAQGTQSINATENSYQSGAAENYRARYRSLSGKFPDFKDAIIKYAKFLDDTATAMEEHDKATTQKGDEKLNDNYNA